MVSCKLVKKSKLMKAGPAKMMSAGDPAPASYVLTDNEDGTITVAGVDANGASVDISAVATLTASSDDTSLLTVDPPAGMVVTVHGIKAGAANVVIVATWTDNSVGPFTITVPCSIGATPPPPPSPVVGLAVTFGTPTIRP